MLLLVSGMEGWACTTECKGRYVYVGSSFIRRWARRRQRNLPQQDWPAKQHVPSPGQESDEEQGWD